MPFIGAAIGAIAAAGSIGGAIAGVGTVAAFAINTALAVGVSLGLGALSRSLAPKPKAGEPLSGVETTVQIGGDIARQIVIGQAGVRGQLVYHNTDGDINQFYQQVFVLSDWVSEELTAVVVNGKRHGLTRIGGSGARTVYDVNGLVGQMRVYFLDGTQASADGTLIDHANPPGRWDENSILAGMTYAMVLWTYAKDSELYEGGIPEVLFELKGARLYDWRKDSTNGGSGAHRWDDPDTWEYSDNPVVATYNFQRGFYRNGERILGMGVPPYDLIHETYTAAANICDETVVTTGPAERRYRCATILTADQDVPYSATLEVLLSTFAGYLYDYGGSYYCQAGAAQLPVKTITDNDLVVGAPVTYSAKRSRADLVNRIHGQFLDRSLNYDAQSYTPQISEGGTINDGEELGRQLDLLSVPSRTQAERIARIRLREARAQASASITLGFNHIDLQVGDWITWNSARYGLKTWRIVNRSVDAQTRAVSLELAETNADVFSWSAADEGVQPAGPIAIQPGHRATTVAGFGFQPVGVKSADGVTEIPGLRFFWDPIQDQTVDGVLIEYRIEGTTRATRVTDNSPLDGEHLVTNGVVGGTDYEARATIVTTPARATTWTPWISGRSTLMQLLVQMNWLAAQVRRDIAEIGRVGEGTLRDNLKKLDDKVEELAQAAATEAGTSYEARKLVKVSIENAFAAIEEEARLRISDSEALAELITTLTARINDPVSGLQASASAIQSLTSRVTSTEDGIIAVVDRTTTLESRANDPATGFGALAALTQDLSTAVQLTKTGGVATSQFIQTLQAQVGNSGSGLIAQMSQVRATTGDDGNAAGLKFQHGVTFVADGAAIGGYRLTGFRRLDGTFQSEFGIHGNMVVTGTIQGSKLVTDSAIITGQLQVGSLVIHNGAVVDDAITQADGETTSGQSAQATITTRAGCKVAVVATYHGDPGPSYALGASNTITLKRNGGTLRTQTGNYYIQRTSTTTSVHMLQTTVLYTHKPGAGTHTYRIDSDYPGGCSILVMELAK